MWDLPGPGLEPVSSALAGRRSTTVPPGKSRLLLLLLLLFLTWRSLVVLRMACVRGGGNSDQRELWAGGTWRTELDSADNSFMMLIFFLVQYLLVLYLLFWYWAQPENRYLSLREFDWGIIILKYVKKVTFHKLQIFTKYYFTQQCTVETFAHEGSKIQICFHYQPLKEIN